MRVFESGRVLRGWLRSPHAARAPLEEEEEEEYTKDEDSGGLR